jgi:hypothetical protein
MSAKTPKTGYGELLKFQRLNHKIDILNKLNIWNNKFKSQNEILMEYQGLARRMTSGCRRIKGT